MNKKSYIWLLVFLLNLVYLVITKSNNGVVMACTAFSGALSFLYYEDEDK